MFSQRIKITHIVEPSIKLSGQLACEPAFPQAGRRSTGLSGRNNTRLGTTSPPRHSLVSTARLFGVDTVMRCRVEGEPRQRPSGVDGISIFTGVPPRYSPFISTTQRGGMLTTSRTVVESG
jgi:hypothetical protein